MHNSFTSLKARTVRRLRDESSDSNTDNGLLQRRPDVVLSDGSSNISATHNLDAAALVHLKSNKAVDIDFGDQAVILVVDDNNLSRRKLNMAVKKLGHKSEVAKDGLEAIEKVRSSTYDAILLDIVMPEMDGFEVLSIIKADTKLRDIPVIVVSSLDEQTDSVVKAIELGAEDFLPKDFDLVLLRARLNASLIKKQFRDKELEYFQRVERLTAAAVVLESNEFSPEDLQIDDLAEYNDPLGRLAAVFRGMANEIYERELRLKRTMHSMQGSFLVVFAGVVWGLTPSLARLSSGEVSNPLGLAIWVNGVTALLCLTISAYRGKLPRLAWSDMQFFLLWAVISGILGRLITLWVAEYVEASALAVIATLQSFIVFAFAAVTKLEKATLRRVLGLLTGLVGVIVVLWTRFESSNAQTIWLAIALLLPVIFALEWAVLATKRPARINIIAAIGIMTLLSTVLLIPIVLFTGEFVPINAQIGTLGILVVLMAAALIASQSICLYLVSTAGPVFASQSAYAMTLAGVVWGMLLLNEALSPLAWLAFAVIILGLYLVEPKPGDSKVAINRSFLKKPNANQR